MRQIVNSKWSITWDEQEDEVRIQSKVGNVGRWVLPTKTAAQLADLLATVFVLPDSADE